MDMCNAVGWWLYDTAPIRQYLVVISCTACPLHYCLEAVTPLGVYRLLCGRHWMSIVVAVCLLCACCFLVMCLLFECLLCGCTASHTPVSRAPSTRVTRTQHPCHALRDTCVTRTQHPCHALPDTRVTRSQTSRVTRSQTSRVTRSDFGATPGRPGSTAFPQGSPPPLRLCPAADRSSALAFPIATRGCYFPHLSTFSLGLCAPSC